VRYAPLEEFTVLNPKTMKPVPADGKTIGEVMMRGNIVMRGYLKNPKATKRAFAGGWFHTGDLGVMYPDGYIQLKDRSKDIIISGGENISSIEVENAIAKHPAVMFVAVVARPDAKWGEHPCAFVELRAGAAVTQDELLTFTRQRLAKFKMPRTMVFSELPKTSTGKIQKFVLRERRRRYSIFAEAIPAAAAARACGAGPKRRAVFRNSLRSLQENWRTHGEEAQFTAALSRSSSSLIRSFCFFRAATRASSQSGLVISLCMMFSIFLCWLDR
jgi:hypothetical protein